MMHHMIACYESTTRVLPYRRFLMNEFEEIGINLSRESH